jgi:hypothetical protein
MCSRNHECYLRGAGTHAAGTFSGHQVITILGQPGEVRCSGTWTNLSHSETGSLRESSKKEDA